MAQRRGVAVNAGVIRLLLAERSWSQQALAEAAGVTGAFVSELLADPPKRRASASTLHTIAAVLGVRPTALLAAGEPADLLTGEIAPCPTR